MNNLVPKDDFSAFEKLAAEESGGRILKFTKDGHWIVGVEEQKLDGIKVLADMHNLAVGARKWVAARITDSNIGFVSNNFVPKSRELLDDNDEKSWPTNSRGEANDPWQFGYYLRLSDEDGVVYVWTAASSGARRAVGDLSRLFLRKRVNPFGRLNASSYRHKEYGKINTPVLEVVGWSDEGPAPVKREFNRFPLNRFPDTEPLATETEGGSGPRPSPHFLWRTTFPSEPDENDDQGGASGAAFPFPWDSANWVSTRH